MAELSNVRIAARRKVVMPAGQNIEQVRVVNVAEIRQGETRFKPAKEQRATIPKIEPERSLGMAAGA